jgi:hypothetical protein
MNHLQKADTLLATVAFENDTASEVAFTRVTAQAGEHALPFSQLRRDHTQENSAELLRQGARIEIFLRGYQ